MQGTYLPGNVRDRILDLMKERKLTQKELAERIGTTESTLSRFLSGNTEKLDSESILRIARVFQVSTDFLLGETDEPGRKNYEIAELGLSVQAARNLYTGKASAEVVSRLLERPGFALLTHQLKQYFEGTLAQGVAAQNEMFDTIVDALAQEKEKAAKLAARDIKRQRTPLYAVELSRLQAQFTQAV